MSPGVSLSPTTVPRAGEISLDWHVLLFTLALTVVTGFVFGVTPLLHGSTRMATALRQGTRTSGGRRVVGSALVVAEVALAVTLVVGAGLLVRSFVNLLRVDAGFERSHLLTFGVVPPVLGSPKTPEEIQARAAVTETRGESSLRGHLKAEGDEQGGSQSYVPPEAKDDKALNMALDLIRGTKINPAFPPNPKSATLPN